MTPPASAGPAEVRAALVCCAYTFCWRWLRPHSLVECPILAGRPFEQQVSCRKPVQQRRQTAVLSGAVRLRPLAERQHGILAGLSFIIAPANDLLAEVVRCGDGMVLENPPAYPQPGSRATHRCLIVSTSADGACSREALQWQVKRTMPIGQFATIHGQAWGWTMFVRQFVKCETGSTFGPVIQMKHLPHRWAFCPCWRRRPFKQ